MANALKLYTWHMARGVMAADGDPNTRLPTGSPSHWVR